MTRPTHPDARSGGRFGLGVGGVDPTAMRGVGADGRPYAAPGSLDAANECRHGRLPGDRSRACGCWVENAPRLIAAGRRLGWTREQVISVVAHQLRELGRVPARDEWKALRLSPSAATIHRVVGWADAIEAAGWPRPVQCVHRERREAA